jgi:peptidoglycan-associated lipoprotein
MKKKRCQIVLFILCLILAIGTGCAKTSTLDREMTTQPKSTITDQNLKDEAAAKLARDRATQQKALEQQTLRDESLKQQSQNTTEIKARMEHPALSDIHFDFDKYVIRAEDRKILKRVATWIMKNNSKTIIIEGNCDERGTTEYNLALGERRAEATMKYLIDLGVNGKNIKTISYGKEKPLDPGHNEEAWAKNRRANFELAE